MKHSSAPSAAPTHASARGAQVSPSIFRAYDIRGLVGEQLDAAIVDTIGRALGREADGRGQQTIVVGRDGRNSSPALGAALIAGLRAAGRDVIDVGLVPTPVLYFATHFLETASGVMLTGSHNGPEYNGLKIVLGNESVCGSALQGVYQRIVADETAADRGQDEGQKESPKESPKENQGDLKRLDILSDYLRAVLAAVPASDTAFKLVVDCGNGVAGVVAPQLFRALGHQVIELYCAVDGSFPNHHPDPSQPANLQALISRVKAEGADLGLAFDGDGDRLGLVDAAGNIIWPDRQLMLLAQDVLSRHAGAPIIFDVKCSRHLRSIIEASGGRAVMYKTGHSLIKARMQEIGAPLAGEMSGHIFFKERWYGFDDALYTAARMLEILAQAGQTPTQVFKSIPQDISTPELRLELPVVRHQQFMQDLQARAAFDGAELIDIDGLRVEFADGWGLVRPSNTTPCLTLRFEADDQSALERIQGEFRTLLLALDADLKLPF